MEKDLYKILGVERSADETEIKKAYRRLAQKYHPDVNKDNPDAEQKFKEVSLAYEVLSDKQKRAQYDQFGFSAFKGGGGPGGFQGGFSGFDPSGFGGGFADIFETFFGAGMPGGATRNPRKRGPQPGNDIESSLTLTFEEAVFGAEKELEITKSDTCPHCKGQGAEPGSGMTSCKECQGTGQVRSMRQTILGQVQTVRTCSQCEGAGQIPEKKCSTCHGQMRTRQKSRITVKIPSGIENASTIRLRAKGEAGTHGGQHGDLYLHIQVKSHPKFERRGYDVYSIETLNLLQAVLGDTIHVDTVHGPVKLKIPAGTQNEQVFKVKGYGVPHHQTGDKGEHYVHIKVEIPKKLNRHEKELYENLVQASHEKIKNSELFSERED